ncbi:MAG TPA: hypothetical protein VER03_07775 [Bryobacteraceae bacterium]|nr:hypothetical protein [Bryobacteraceae bacterium]
MKKFAYTAIASLALFASSMFGADLNGKWTAEMEGRDGQKRTTVFNFKTEAGALTGTVSGMGGQESKIEEGKITGDEVTFSVTREFQGQSRKQEYKGKIVGEELQLKVGQGDRARDIVAKKATS